MRSWSSAFPGAIPSPRRTLAAYGERCRFFKQSGERVDLSRPACARSYDRLRPTRLCFLAAFLASSFLRLNSAETAPPAHSDLVILGATPAGIAAAVSAARLGEKVTLVEPSYLVGGMMAGGLTKTDIGDRKTVGGLSAEFFSRIEKYYTDRYGANSSQVKQSS